MRNEGAALVLQKNNVLKKHFAYKYKDTLKIK